MYPIVYSYLFFQNYSFKNLWHLIMNKPYNYLGACPNEHVLNNSYYGKYGWKNYSQTSHCSKKLNFPNEMGNLSSLSELFFCQILPFFLLHSTILFLLSHNHKESTKTQQQ